MTAALLSELTGLSAQAISQYEKNRSTPSPDVLARLGTVLNLPQHFFLSPSRSYERGTVFYRSMSSTTKSARIRAEGRFGWLRDVVEYLSGFVAFPAADFPDLQLPTDPLLLADDEIENAADELRRYWNMHQGPIANAVLLLENHGAVIARDALGAETLDSLSELDVGDRRPYIILGTDKGSPVRWRFDTAHELGHIILHAHLPREQLAKAEHFKKIEQQAHRFAAAFLLPLASFGDDLFAINLDALLAIKPKWKVSISMMIMRARNAGFLSEDAERRLWINYSRRGWRRHEPYDDSMKPEIPRLLRTAFDLVLSEGAMTPEDIVSDLALSATDVETLSGLPAGYLSNYSRVALFRESAPKNKVVENHTTPGEVIRLPRRR